MMDTPLPESAPSISDGMLRQFAGLCLAIFASLFAWSWYRHAGHPTAAAWVALAIAAVVGVPGLVSPPAARPVFLGAMAITKPIRHVVSAVMLGVIFFGLITPLAFAFRLAGRDVLRRRPSPAASYWMRKRPPKSKTAYLRQYQSE